jgi:predicted O-methyltransferase YrrM
MVCKLVMEQTRPHVFKKYFMSEPLYDYMVAHSVREEGILKQLRHETDALRGGQMISPAEQGQLLQFIIKMLAPKHMLEVGVFTGYGTLCMALASGEDAHITGLENRESYQEISIRYWEKADVADKISVIYGDALESMEKLVDEGKTYDFIFLDADKERYQEYYELGLKLLPKGGVMMVDNIFAWGLIIDKAKTRRILQKMRAFNTFVHQDERVDITTLPMADGITLLLKR